MGKVKDLTGEVFGRLKVLEITPERRNRQVVWKCECECGNIAYVVGQALRTGHTKSCGCLNYERKDADSLKGQIFGKLTVLERSTFSFNNKAYWTCKCECGRTLDVCGTDLRNKNIDSCENCQDDHHYYFNDLTDIRFGLLTAIKSVGRDKSGHHMWECQCDCGGMATVSSIALISGNTSSCGCLRNHSVGEAIINRWLLSMNCKFRRQITFEDCLSPKGAKLKYDFGIYDNHQNLLGLIEYDGIQHSRPIDFFGGEDAFNYLQECDIIKCNYATQHNIPLLRINYSNKDKISSILDKWLWEVHNACL
jgi:hypothetical protein